MTTESMPAVLALSEGLGGTTVSRVLMSGTTCEPERALLRKWAEHAAANGGSFSVRNDWTESQWYTTWTINWPRGTKPDAA